MTKQASTPPTPDKRPSAAPPRPPAWRHWLWLVALALFVVLYAILPTTTSTRQVTLNYSQFMKDVSAHSVKTVTIQTNGSASGTLTKGTSYTTVIPPQAGENLLRTLQDNGVEITATASGSSFGSEVLLWLILLLPFLVIGWLWFRLSRGGSSQFQAASGVGRSKARLFDEERPSTTFADVAGYEGAKLEIREVVDFLRRPGRYARAGATAPRGILMFGPPGTGKTLLARAVAGEAEVPFFSVSGSSFVEMFVGVGASRVRDLFAEARKRAPAIIFVDEVDAIGQRRAGTGTVVANDEREQTLNQLLAEMDGFDPATGIVVLAATNRPEVLDPALLRPGRFDRQVTIPLPTLAERTAILRVHVRGKRLDPTVDLGVVARGTPGFSGADLANLVNEAAIVAVRDEREVLSAKDFDDARDRIILGRREGSNVLLPEERHSVAVHESGHALVAALSENADPVAKVTILPAGMTLGVTEQLPLIERHLYGEDYLYDSLAVRLGGRAAELVTLGRGSTGAANDLASATQLAVKMVREFGLSAELGPVGYPEGGSVFLGGGGSALSSRPFAEQTQAEIDAEVSRLLREAEQRAVSLLSDHREELEQLVQLLMVEETVDGEAVYRIAGRPVPTSRGDEVTVAPGRAKLSAAVGMANGVATTAVPGGSSGSGPSVPASAVATEAAVPPPAAHRSTSPRPRRLLPFARTVLAVCAHPYDASFGLGAALSTLSEQRVAVAVMSFSHGEGPLPGEEATRPVREVRMQELRAAASVLGVTSAELFDYPYGSLAEVPIGSLVSDVRRLVSEQQPDLLLVFDEAGVSGHPDHRAATESALLAAEDLPVLAWVLPDEVTSTLNAEAGTAFVGRPGDEIDMETEVDRARQLEAIACHGSRWAANAVLARRLELQGSRECFRWLRPPHALDAETAAERAAAR